MRQNPTTRSEITRRNVAEALVRSLPFTTTLAALLMGIGLGALARGWLAPASHSIAYVETASLGGVLQDACTPALQEVDTQLGLVARDLERVTVRRAAEERARAGADGVARSALEVQYAKSTAELEYLDRLHSALVEQRTRIRERLVAPDARIAEQLAVSDLLRDPHSGQLVEPRILDAWIAWLQRAEVQVCGADLVRTTYDCQAALYGELARLRGSFVACQRTGADLQVRPRADDLPPNAHPLGDVHPKLRGWVVQLCDAASASASH